MRPHKKKSRSLSGSPTPSPPHNKHRVGPHPHRPHGKLYSSHHLPRFHHYTGRPQAREQAQRLQSGTVYNSVTAPAHTVPLTHTQPPPPPESSGLRGRTRNHQVTQQMVNALLVECRTRTGSHPNNVAASTCGVKGETQTETEQDKQSAEGTKEAAKNHTEEEVKKQERERKEREARKEARERERMERERRAWEKEERAKRERDERTRKEREKREEERREWQRRERERRERKRAHGEGLSGSRWSCRSEGYKQSSWTDAQRNSSQDETTMVEDEDHFPFNMSDFVTLDEVGDVTDLPCSPAVVPMETTDREEEDAPTSVPQDTTGDTPMEVAIETAVSDATVTLLKSDQQVSESEPVRAPTADSSDRSSGLTLGPVLTAAASTLPAPQAESSLSQTPETEITPLSTLDSTPEVQHLSVPAPAASGNPPEAAPADSSSNSPAIGAVTAESEDHKKEESPLSHSQAKEEETVLVLDKTEGQEKMQDQEDKETGAPAAETGKQQTSKDQTNGEEKKTLQMKTPMSTDYSLPSFDPSNPVGMEFLVPKTGFFCTVCNRFFSGTKEAEINHCRTIKHYENLKKYLQTEKTLNVTDKPDPS